MNSRRLVWVGLTCLFTITQCKNDNQLVTEGGTVINYVKKGTGDLPTHGETVSLNMEYRDEDDRIIYDTKSVGDPVQIFFDTAGWRRAGPLYHVMANLRVGDSVYFNMSAEDLYHKTFAQRLPDTIRAGSDLTFRIGFVSSLTKEDMDRIARAQQFKVDEEIIDQYLESNNIDAQSTGSGLHYVIHDQGEGPQPQYGDEVVVHYIGELLDGTQFDSSYERKEPFVFTCGYGHVVAGWDEGIELLGKGGKATLYVPSPLAYGEAGLGGNIGPNSILKFDVELVDIR